ncbi:MAG: TolC family protein [Nitrospirae bacterium YQR-1]
MWMLSKTPILLIAFFLLATPAFAVAELDLDTLVTEALIENHEVLMANEKVFTAEFKIPQAGALPDPMFMFGYQNESWNRYTYGEMQDAQWMFSLSQTFPFPGKLALKEEMLTKESLSLKESARGVKFRTVARIKELYYSLLYSTLLVDTIQKRMTLFSRVEDAALARYSSGMGSQQDVLMAQTEKYMAIEKEIMEKQRLQSLEGMLNVTMGREVNSPLGKPVKKTVVSYKHTLEELIKAAYDNSPEIKAREKMLEVAATKIAMAKKEFYPDVTLSAAVAKRTPPFEDMWSLTATVNIPIFYKQKQEMGVMQARSEASSTTHELDAYKYMVSSALRELLSMVKAAETLTDLYQNVMIPKAYQDFELSLSSYISGKSDALTVVSRLKSLLDYEILYNKQYTEREKAIAQIEAVTGAETLTSGAKGEQLK